MNLDLSADDLTFREEVRAFLAEAFTPDLRAAARRQAGVWADIELALAWHRALYARGWIAPNWPVEHGGTGWTDVQKWIFDAECAAAGTPSVPVMGLRMCGPVLIAFGTAEQKTRFLPPILSGEHLWCQGYSEPQAGSDLAALQCQAVRDGDDYVVTGTKIWTTYAHCSNWMFCLTRTDAGDKPQHGITFLLIAMDSPGIKVRPLITLAGDHEVNQVFLDGVRVPANQRVGAENQGWAIAKYLLEHERGGSYAARIKAGLRDARAAAAAEGVCADDPLWATLAALAVEADAIDLTERRIISAMSRGQSPGAAASSLLKLAGTEAVQRVNAAMTAAIGPWACADYCAARHGQANWAPGPEYAVPMMGRYLNNRAATIYGGSSEVQRNILAKVALGV